MAHLSCGIKLLVSWRDPWSCSCSRLILKPFLILSYSICPLWGTGFVSCFFFHYGLCSLSCSWKGLQLLGCQLSGHPWPSEPLLLFACVQLLFVPLLSFLVSYPCQFLLMFNFLSKQCAIFSPGFCLYLLTC